LSSFITGEQDTKSFYADCHPVQWGRKSEQGEVSQARRRMGKWSSSCPL